MPVKFDTVEELFEFFNTYKRNSLYIVFGFSDSVYVRLEEEDILAGFNSDDLMEKGLELAIKNNIQLDCSNPMYIVLRKK